MTCPAFNLLCAILLALASISVCTARTVYVKPDRYHHPCPGEPCHTLAFYAQQVPQYFVSNTTMVFLNGTHYMEALQPIVIRKVGNFNMKGSSMFTHRFGAIRESSSKIECVGTHLSGFNFINVIGIQIENLTFTNCGQHVYGDVRAALSFDEARDVVLSRVMVCNSSGFGLHADNVFGHVLVYESVFVHNTGNKKYYGGNVRFWYGKCPENHTTYLQIESSHFLHGYDTSKKYHYYYPSATGLTLQISCPAITVNINNITVSGNQADNGGNLAIKFTYVSGSYYNRSVPSVLIDNSRIAGGIGHRGGGLRVWSIISPANTEGPEMNNCYEHCILRISNTQFVGNHAIAGGGALYISHYQTKHIDCITRQIFLKNCTFSSNTIPPSGKGAVMEVIKHRILGYLPHVSSQFELTFHNCSFHNNSLLRDEKGTFFGATVNIFSMEKVIFKNCNFTKNNNTALSLVDSSLVLEGDILFEGNRAINGGALRFCDTSLVYIRNNTHITFRNNHAKVAGGAIYAQQRCLESSPPCFFQPVAPDFTHISDLKPWMNLTFDSNTANYSGDGLYGGAVDYCFTYLHFKTPWHHSGYYFSSEIFNTIFDFTQQPGISNISSDPYGVCLCDESGRRNCSIKSYKFPKSVHPGEMFNISATTVGQRHGVAPATIKATVTSSHNISRPIKRYPNTSNRCVTLTYVLYSQHEQETLELTVEQSIIDQNSFYYRYPPPNVTVLLKPCPWGFTLQHDPPYCDCDPKLVRYKISCNINNQTIQRVVPVWIGYDDSMQVNTNNSVLPSRCTNQTTCQGVVVHRHCPYDYCILMKVNISLNSTDEQCAFNRTGTLCGKCPDGLSLVLGSSKCLHCSNFYLFLVIVFALAGLMLVTFLIVCNLTVSEGMINGIVFYANVVHINRSIYFPSTETNPLAVFIAWLNLDLGIETCFYNGMDGYTKAWLQFAFPTYIWLIAGMIIILSRKYRIAARLSGRNAVKVLATLFLLSAAKLGRAIITVLSYTSIHYSDSLQVSVWLPDANVRYLQGKHIPLFITAVVFWLLHFCFIIVLTFIQCLQKKSDTLPLLWVNKLKPLFDAYTGPYKDRYRFWPGFLLLLLSILFFLFALNRLDEPSTKLTLTAIGCFFIFALVWVFHGVYRKRPLDMIESMSVLNLGLLSVSTNYILIHHNSPNTQTVIVSISVGIIFTMFIMVIGYQGYKQLTTSLCWKSFVTSLSIRRSESQQALEEPITNRTDIPSPDLVLEQASSMTEQLLPVIRFDKYREPVFEYEDQNS